MRIKIHPAFMLYICLTAICASPSAAATVLTSLLLHEAGHYCAAKIIKEPIKQIDITPFGGIMTYSADSVASKGIRGFLLAAAGPAANYLGIIAATIPEISKVFSQTLIREWISANAVMMLMNLIPALPLDGGRMVFCIGYYFFKVTRMSTILSYAGMLMGIAMITLAVYGITVYQLFNCSLFLIGAYLMISAYRSRSDMLAENLFAVVTERMAHSSAIQRLSFICVPMHAKLYTLLEHIQRTETCFILYRDLQERIHIIDEKNICRLILDTPAAEVSTIEGRIVPIQGK